MLMLNDSASLASVDAISAHNVDALSNGNVHNLTSDMNPGSHPKVIRLDRNQKRENRFWRKQRVREKKQRKWEEQVRKQKEEEQDGGVADGENGEAISDNDPADEHEDGDSADEVDNDDDPDDASLTAHDEDNVADANADELDDSGYKAEEDDELEPVHSGEDHTPASEDEHRNADEDAEDEDDGKPSLDEETRDSARERIEETGSYLENNRYSSEREERAESVIERGRNDDELDELKGGEGSSENGTEHQQEDRNVENESGEHNDLAKDSDNDNQFDGNVTEDNEDADARSESKHPEDDEEPNPDADAANQTPEQPYRDGYETDDERERTRDDRDDEERDSAVGGSSEDQAGHDDDQRMDSASGSGAGSAADRPASDWVGPRSVSPYIEQQLAGDGDGVSATQEQQQQEQEEAADSAVERDSVFSADEEAVLEPAGTRPDSETQKRPPSRVSLVYTYASGPKVLSHVELAPETEAERRPSSGKSPEAIESAEGTDDKNGKHVTFQEDVRAASSVRIRRRRSDDEQDEVKQWKEIRKKNKERRKNRTSNTFRSSSTTGSLMNDKRLIKTGNIGTLVLHGQPQTIVNTGGPSLTDIIRYQEARRRDAGLQSGPTARRGLANGRRRDDRIRTPPAVAGRKHYRGQTEPYLEELRDRRRETDRAVQTDPMLDRPSTPLFVPSKTGADVGTQIYEGDLFDFELESAPILEVLVGKTVEQSLLEVMEEEELETLKEHQRRFEERRQAELAEQQRLAERERRHVEEKDRRMSQRRSALEQEQETEAKVAASALAQNYLADMVPAVFSNLRQKGFFFNGIERDIETTFMPWLRDAVEQELDKVLTGREVLDELILDAVRKRREELEQRPQLSSRLPAAPLADPAAGAELTPPAAEPAAAPAADEAEDESEEDGDAEDEDEEDGAGDEGSDEEDAAGGKTGEEAAPEPDDDEP